MNKLEYCWMVTFIAAWKCTFNTYLRTKYRYRDISSLPYRLL